MTEAPAGPQGKPPAGHPTGDDGKDHSSGPRRAPDGSASPAAQTVPPGASEPQPQPPRTPTRAEPEDAPLPANAQEDLPEGQYGTAGEIHKPRH